MHMTANFEPIPDELHGKIKSMTTDLRRARELMMAGRLTPPGQAALDRHFAQRIERIEAEVHARLMRESMRGRVRGAN